MRHRITLIPGDGIGPEVTDAVVRILQTRRRGRSNGTGTTRAITAFERYGESLPAELLDVDPPQHASR